jgi:hypothetical protein
MLQKLADHISEAWLHAAEWDERAREAPNESQRQGCLRLAKAFSNLAKSYTLVHSQESFLLDLHNGGWPSKVFPPDLNPHELGVLRDLIDRFGNGDCHSSSPRK